MSSASEEIDPQTEAQWFKEEIVDIAAGNVITVTVGGAPGAGAGKIYVDFIVSAIS